MKKSIFMWIVLIIVAILCFSCEEPYKMPYTPGVTVDEEAFNEHKSLWENSGIKNYSYTYTVKLHGYPYNHIIDVTVKEGKVYEYILREYKYKKESELTVEDKLLFESELESIDSLLIENIYNYINQTIKSNFESYKKNKENYYANFIFEFSDSAPFIVFHERTSLFMGELLNGNGSTIEIKIENFKEN
ncbi:MAG: hypothetical protein E7062_01970 [Spirochaetaceae bacterium]|nr:hypothetical protein [Spirochaetaceae bacterium]